METFEDFMSCYGQVFQDPKHVWTELYKRNYFDAPASSRHHGAVKGGLYAHSMTVANYLRNWTERIGIQWQEGSNPERIGLLHDLCKCDSYIFEGEGVSIHAPDGTTIYPSMTIGWNKDQLFSGHGYKSIAIASTILTLTEEEAACILYHMGPFEGYGYTKEEYSRACDKYPNIMWVHHADMMATHKDKI